MFGTLISANTKAMVERHTNDVQCGKKVDENQNMKPVELCLGSSEVVNNTGSADEMKEVESSCGEDDKDDKVEIDVNDVCMVTAVDSHCAEQSNESNKEVDEAKTSTVSVDNKDETLKSSDAKLAKAVSETLSLPEMLCKPDVKVSDATADCNPAINNDVKKECSLSVKN